VTAPCSSISSGRGLPQVIHDTVLDGPCQRAIVGSTVSPSTATSAIA
jgi:hypothetical protein